MPYTRLSESKIWEIMGDYYNHIGPDAWIEEIVPSDISSNKYLASIYAELILAKLLDWQKEGGKAKGKKLYIIEIGTGHGKFGSYILKLLQKLTQDSDKELFYKIKYIMTDISEKNVESWNNHLALQEFVKMGVLDFALFNAASDNKIELIKSKQTISKNSLDSPIIAICNYLIDTLSHDSFKVKDHKLYENLIQINTKQTKKPSKKSQSKNSSNTNYFENLKYKFNINPVNTNYYNCKHLNKILQQYTERFKKGSFLIPFGGISCIKNLEKFTTKHLITLIADKGYSDLAEVEDLDNPEISLHGSVSLMVNFDALERFFASKNGISFMMPNKWADFQIGCFINKKIDAPKLKQAYYKNLNDFSPQDLFNLCYTDDDEINPTLNSINAIIAILQLTKWDPGIFSSLVYKLIDLLEDADQLYLQHEKVLAEGAAKVWEYYYDLGNNQDICFLIGLLYYAISYYSDAIKFFELSLKNFEISAETYYNLALSYDAINKNKLTRESCKKALEINPKYSDAKKLLREVGRNN